MLLTFILHYSSLWERGLESYQIASFLTSVPLITVWLTQFCSQEMAKMFHIYVSRQGHLIQKVFIQCMFHEETYQRFINVNYAGFPIADGNVKLRHSFGRIC